MTIWITTLCALALTDIAFGIAYAYITKRLNSTIARDGMIRKVAMFILIGVGYIVTDPLSMYVNFHIGELLAVFFCLSELLSVLRYAALLGVPLPSRLRHALEEVTRELNGDNDDSDDNGGNPSAGGGFFNFFVLFAFRPLWFFPRF